MGEENVGKLQSRLWRLSSWADGWEAGNAQLHDLILEHWNWLSDTAKFGMVWVEYLALEVAVSLAALLLSKTLQGKTTYDG